MKRLFMLAFLILTILNHVSKADRVWGGLYPRETPTRDVKNLDGFWDFRLAPRLDPDQGFREKWYQEPLRKSGPVISMPVPSSYNDVTEDKALRDHVGWVWYDRTFFVPETWSEQKRRVVIRIGSADYYAMMYLNGEYVMDHEGGHLPFMADVTLRLKYNTPNLITIAINNTLTPQTIPQGKIVHQTDPSRYPPGYFVQTLDFDFFNYAGLHRPNFIYTTPQTYVDDVTVTTDVDGTNGIVSYDVLYETVDISFKEASCSVKVLDWFGNHVTSAIGCQGTINIENATLWWPYLMHERPGYQYTLMVTVSDQNGVLDTYPQKFGIRKMTWNSTTLAMNGKPLYLRGCGKHEDADIRGKGVDLALIRKDFSLLKWLGANSFRTSHYPYAEEIMDMADEEGIMVIDESPAVGLSGFGDALLMKHMSVMEELYRRDKNRPSVIMWSVGNEPRSNQAAARNYFKEIVSWTKAFDATRPVTCVLSVDLLHDQAAPSLDILLINRYYAWYSDTGHTEVIERQTYTEFSTWHLLYSKPVMISEYGAGTLAAIHIEPGFTWSEEYQVELMMANFKAFDTLRNEGFFIGEMIWNFADFATEQETFRPPGCMKGVFTRSRQPKMAAHLLSYRYKKLASELDEDLLQQDEEEQSSVIHHPNSIASLLTKW